ncbi:hypothetical protein ACH5RR_001523 [Cinchona calisaya]|uniref:BHLH domain-containing protein n=1 Tax=Cinchona calisaya TaxID=153742 RepID=A0ABD3B3M3_9GENT
MDNSATSWFSELGMEDPFLNNQCDIMDFFGEDLFATLRDDFHSSSTMEVSPIAPLCASSVVETPPSVGTERAAKQLKRNGHTSSPIILTFGNPRTPELMNHQQVNLDDNDAVSEVLTSHNGSFANLDVAIKSVPETKKGRTRPASQTYDHIIAERKRREQLSQRFVALSGIVPGLKKMDKTSVLGDAITYLKHLQDRVKTLEEQATKKTMESVVLVKKSQILVEDEGSSDLMGSTDEQPLPEIEAKLCDKKVLFRIQCENRRGVLIKILFEIEKLNLAVTNTSVASFGSLALDITVIAEMEKEFSLTMKEIVKSLGSSLQHVARVDWNAKM